jgi:HSP20 family protein
MEGTKMTNLSVYDAMLPAFRGFFKADPYQILDTVFDREYFPVAAAARSPVVDVREKDGKYLIEAELPGVSEKDLKLELKNGLLTLSTEKKEESKEKDDSGLWIRRERRESFFSRSFELPEDADGDKIEARFKDGLLTVELPRKPEASPRIVPVKAA